MSIKGKITNRFVVVVEVWVDEKPHFCMFCRATCFASIRYLEAEIVVRNVGFVSKLGYCAFEVVEHGNFGE